MLMKYVARAKFGAIRNIIFPVFHREQLLFFLPTLMLIVVPALLFWDIYLFLIAAVVGYVVYCASMQHFLPFLLEIEENDLEIVSSKLLKSGVWTESDALTWVRRSPFGWSQSDLDRILISPTTAGYTITGRKDYIRALASVLRSEKQQQ